MIAAMSGLRSWFWNPQQARVRAGWRIVIQMASTMAIALGSFRLAALVWVDPRPSADSPLSLFLFHGVLTLLVTALTVWLAGRYLDRRRFAGFGLNIDKSWSVDFLFGLSLGALLIGLVFVIELAAGWITIVDTFHTLSPQHSFVEGILVFAFLFICIGIAEELMSRGYQIKNLAEGLQTQTLGGRKAILLAWLIASVVFGLLHIPNPNATVLSTVNIFFGGITLGVAYVLTGQLAIPIGLHISWNFCLGNVFGFPVSGRSIPGEIATFVAVEQTGPEVWTGGTFGPEAGLVGLIASVAGILATIAWLRLRRQPVAVYAPLASPPASADRSSTVDVPEEG
jgi:membrane protease YdiL (CAAX protease family)